MNNKLKYLIVSICILLQTILFTFSVSASDIQEDAANKLYSLGLFKGTQNGFELNRQATRAEGLAMFIRIIGAEEEALSGEYTYMHPFSDVPSWANGYVGYAYCKGLSHGVSYDTFGASQQMSVEEYTTLILRALGYDDSNGDFRWNTSIEKAKEIGMLSSEEAADLVSKSATRGSMTQLSLSALTQPIKNNKSATLAHNLVDKGIITKSLAYQYGILKEQGKPYLADTLVKAVKLSDEPQDGTDFPSRMMTLDKNNNNLFYYDRIKNEINKINIYGNKVANKETLLDVNNVTYTAVADNSAVTYKDFKIYQIFWDNINNRLIISGEFKNIGNSGNDDWFNDSYKSKYGGFFILENQNLRFFHEFPNLKVSYDRGSDVCSYILCAMNNGSYVVSTSEYSGYQSTHIWDPELDTSTCLTGYDAKIFDENGQNLYIAGSYTSDTGIYKYNYAEGESEPIADTNVFNEVYFQNNIFYLWNYEGVKAVRTNGQSKTMFTTNTDIDIKDMTGFPKDLSYFCFVVTNDESFIFYDSFSKSIRIIYQNPDNR